MVVLLTFQFGKTRNLLWRNSFRLAGKDVLINHLTNNLTLIKEISGNDDLLLIVMKLYKKLNQYTC